MIVNKSFIQACLVVFLLTAIMCLAVYLDYFKAAHGIELGIARYAERVIPTWRPYIPKRIQMPFNSLINGGYVMVGAAWCAAISILHKREKMTDTEAFCFYVFNLTSCCSGPIQFLRIMSQLHGFGVLDQWYTLPFFMWIFIWGLYMKYGWSAGRAIILTLLSVSSYISVLYYRFAFEICLGIHIILALTGAILAWSRHSQAKVWPPFVKALISCAGFVGFKLLDHTLPLYHEIFRYISGHFISKIFDIGQIFYCNQFFLAMTIAANNDKKKKKM